MLGCPVRIRVTGIINGLDSKSLARENDCGGQRADGERKMEKRMTSHAAHRIYY